MRLRLGLGIAGALALSACANFEEPKRAGTPTAERKPPVTSGRYTLQNDEPPLPSEVPPDISNIPDAVPRHEPPSRYGNPATYTVLGKSYQVRQSAHNFRERGHASWYGRKFHGHRTSSGERYDMFGMTAAHKTLPLPTYVRVTRVDTGKSVVVKVNDRGPFHSGRIIDLSYAAAAKLDMLRLGSVAVEIEAVTSGGENLAPPATVAVALPITPAVVQQPRRGWLQVASYADAINALSLREDLAHAGIAPVEIWSGGGKDAAPLHRVLVGPFPENVAAQTARDKLLARGLSADWVNE